MDIRKVRGLVRRGGKRKDGRVRVGVARRLLGSSLLVSLYMEPLLLLVRKIASSALPTAVAMTAFSRTDAVLLRAVPVLRAALCRAETLAIRAPVRRGPFWLPKDLVRWRGILLAGAAKS